MNIKNTLLAGAAVLGLAQMASADVTFKLTGSTANADATHQAILHTFAQSGNALTGYAYETSALAGSKVAIFKGTISGVTGNVYVKTHFNGSELGVQSTAHGDNITFLASSVADSAAVGGTPSVATSSETDISAPSACMSDTAQGTSRFASGANVSVNGTYVTYTALTGWDGSTGITGVVPFKFIATGDAPFSNLTTAQAQALWAAGKIGLDAFTGLAADATKGVYATGRDIDSGTRLNAMLAIGLSANAQIKQYQPSVGNTQLSTASVGTTTNRLIAFPGTPINGVTVALYNGGYNSGGNLSKALANPATAFGSTAGGAPAAIIGYAGVNDCDPRIGSGASNNKELSFNGVTLGTVAGNYNNNTALTGGLYTFWCYEHMYFSAATASDNTGINSVGTAIATQLKNVDAVVLTTSMTVTRPSDGASINY
jgi:hypothetical protein